MDMDAAGIVVSALIEKLRKESPSIILKYPMLETQFQAAIDKLHLLKRRLKVAEDFVASTGHSIMNDHQRMIELLQAVYSAGDAAYTMLTREEFQIKTKINGSKKRVQWPSITSLWSRRTTSAQSKTFEDEFREYLSSYDRLLEMTSDIKGDDVAGFNIGLTRWGSENDHEGLRWGRISDRCLKEETDVVGLQELIDDLLNLLLIPEDDRSSQVIAVVGGAGSGKTTLVKNVYNKLLAMRVFKNSAWVHVPSPSMFKARYVLADVIKQNKQTNFRATTVSEEELHEELTETLRDKYLLVIEDVESPQVWDVLYRNHISSSRNFGNRIILTTRNDDVAQHVARDSGGSILKVCQLNNQSSWELFLNKLQREEDILNKSNLIEFKDQILKVCGGLPSRVALLGGLLYIKEGRCDEWSRVIELANKIGGDLFGLCYHDLPSQVKPCFLYLGVFPRGFEIPVRRLIHLWLSEGFVTVPSGSDPATEIVPEDLAEMYFEELVIRNMIQVRWRLDGSPKTCWMPHVLYDIFSPKAADVGFYHQLHDSSNRQSQFAVQRLVESLGIKNKSRSSILHLDVENIRACVAFDTRMPCRPAMEIGTLLDKIISTEKGFGLLKILDLEGVYKPVLPDDAIGKLFLLSYLSLRSTAIDSLPSSVGDLPCLETLDVKHTIIHDLPTSIWKAKKLRHLYLNWSCSSNFRSLSQPPQPPTNLHTLWGLSIDDGGFGFLGSLTGLRRLGLTCTSGSTAEATAQWVSQLTELQSLKLRSLSEEIIILPTMDSLQNLQDLYLLGELWERSLTNVEFPPKLKMLTLSSSRLENDPMPVLGGLPHLHILRLSNIFSGRYTKMTCSSGGFPKLRVLKLWKLPIKEWIVEEGAMPYLRELEVRNCELFPRQGITYSGTITGLQHLTALKKVALIDVSGLQISEFVGSQERDIHVYKK